MTTILPQSRSPWQVIDQAIGSQLSQNLPGAVQQGYERGQIQSGLQQVAQQHPGLKKLLDSIAPFAGTRQGAQYTEAIIPEVMKLLQTEQQTSPKTRGTLEDIQTELNNRQNLSLPNFAQPHQQAQFQPQPIQASNKKIVPQFEHIQEGIRKNLGEQYFPTPTKAANVEPGETRRPQKPPKPPKPLGPVEKQKIRAQLRESGVDRKELQDDYIAQFEKLQNDEYKAAQEGYKGIKEYQSAKAAEDERFFKETLPAAKERFPGMGAREENIWKGIARTNEDVGSDEARLRDTNERYYELIEKPIAAFTDTGPALPYFSILKPDAVKDAVEESRSLIQDHLNTLKNTEVNDSFPQELKSEATNYLREKYRTAMVAKDFGVSQAAYAVSNISPKTERSILSLPEFPTQIYSENAPPEKQIRSQRNIDLDQSKATEKLAECLLKLDPEDSLLLARDLSISKNYSDESFNRALRIAIDRGLVLSPFQRGERPELSIPQKLDLNSVMRGKRSMFDLLKGKK